MLIFSIFKICFIFVCSIEIYGASAGSEESVEIGDASAWPDDSSVNFKMQKYVANRFRLESELDLPESRRPQYRVMLKIFNMRCEQLRSTPLEDIATKSGIMPEVMSVVMSVQPGECVVDKILDVLSTTAIHSAQRKQLELFLGLDVASIAEDAWSQFCYRFHQSVWQQTLTTMFQEINLLNPLIVMINRINMSGVDKILMLEATYPLIAQVLLEETLKNERPFERQYLLCNMGLYLTYTLFLDEFIIKPKNNNEGFYVDTYAITFAYEQFKKDFSRLLSDQKLMQDSTLQSEKDYERCEQYQRELFSIVCDNIHAWTQSNQFELERLTSKKTVDEIYQKIMVVPHFHNSDFMMHLPDPESFEYLFHLAHHTPLQDWEILIQSLKGLNGPLLEEQQGRVLKVHTKALHQKFRFLKNTCPVLPESIQDEMLSDASSDDLDVSPAPKVSNSPTKRVKNKTSCASLNSRLSSLLAKRYQNLVQMREDEMTRICNDIDFNVTQEQNRRDREVVYLRSLYENYAAVRDEANRDLTEFVERADDDVTLLRRAVQENQRKIQENQRKNQCKMK